MNNSYLLDEVHNAEPGEKIYFQRMEVIDSNTCNFCKKMNGVIVLWSDHPLPDDKIKDPIANFAIWDGKDWDGKKDFIANGILHPYCRGGWSRYYDGTVDALIAHTKNQSEIYDRAIDTAREEFKEKGIKNPTETTPGFTQRVEELFNQKNGTEDGEMGKAFNPNRDAIGRFAPDAGGLGGGGREPWDSSTDKAKELKAEDWGTPEEIAEMAKPIRAAKNRKEATAILREIRKKGILENRADHTLKATISKDSINKLVSDKALYDSLDKEAHWMAVANIDKLYSNGIEPWNFELNPNKNNQDLKARRILYAPLEYKNEIIPIKLTIKEFQDEQRGTRLYSVEAIDIALKEQKKDAGQQKDGVIEKSTALSFPARRPSVEEDAGILARGLSKSDPAISPRQHPLYTVNLPHIFDPVNDYLQKREKSVLSRVKKALGVDPPVIDVQKIVKKSYAERVKEALEYKLSDGGTT
jgi:hypothetical protein